MASEAQNASSLIGKTIGGRFTIKATIGSGGMGHVYRATQSPLNREVAIKVLRVDLAHQEGVAERFEREALAASRIQHPNAITIFEFGKDGEILFLAMEFLAGETLRQRLRREPALEINEALDMFESMAGALGAAHKVGVVHRDLKPDNIFLAKFDTVGQIVKVLDFGLAKLLDTAAQQNDQLTAPNLRLGTPRYMAPEQALGIQPIDSRCDVYALGLLLFEMLAQRAPFTGEDGMEVLAQRLRREAPRLSQIAPQKNFSEEMDDLLSTMLKRDREHRPQDANVVLGRIREIRKNNQVHKQAVAEAAETLVNAPDPALGRSGTFNRPGAGGSYPPPAGGAAPRSRPPTEGPRPALRQPEAMVRLDQDDFPDKPTVVVDPGMGAEQIAAMQVRTSSPGPMGMGLGAPPPMDPQQQHQMQMYQSGAGGAGSIPQLMPGSASVPPVAQKKKRTVLLVSLVIAVAVLAPVIALLVRFAKGGSDEHIDPPPAEVRPSKPAPPPPPPPDSEVKTPPEPVNEPANSEKGGKKVGKKKSVGGKAKPEAKPPAKPTKPIF